MKFLFPEIYKYFNLLKPEYTKRLLKPFNTHILLRLTRRVLIRRSWGLAEATNLTNWNFYEQTRPQQMTAFDKSMKVTTVSVSLLSQSWIFSSDIILLFYSVYSGQSRRNVSLQHER